MLYFLISIAAVLIAFNAYASRVALRSQLSDRGQKKAQLLLIWLVPVLGAFLTVQVLKGSSRGSWFGGGGAVAEPEQAWMHSGHGDDCPPGDPAAGNDPCGSRRNLLRRRNLTSACTRPATRRISCTLSGVGGRVMRGVRPLS